MKNVFISTQRCLDRRQFLRGAGVALALPFLDAMRPAFGAAAASAPPRRMIAIQTNMGILPQFFFPEKDGRDYELTPYLQKLAASRDAFTVFSGTSLPGVTGGHVAEKCFLTGTPHPERGGFRNGISLDQFVAERIGNQTRHPSLVIASSFEGQSLSYTRNGAKIPAENSPNKLFRRLFTAGKPEEVELAIQKIKRGQSLLDFVGGQSRRLSRELSPGDRQRMEEYFTAVRELEQRFESEEGWERKPKPTVDAQPPTDDMEQQAFAKRMKLFFGVLKVALETDSTRTVSFFVDAYPIHAITHHGNRPKELADLQKFEGDQFAALGGFLESLAAAKEEGKTLLESTMVLYGTCMGSANSHSNVNLPVLLAGGGFKHGQHLAFDKVHNYPLSNLFVSMLQRLGIETSEFSTGRETMRGLEIV